MADIQKELELFPLDDYRFWLSPPSGNVDATVAAVEHAALVTAVVGELPTPAASAPAPKGVPVTTAPAFNAPALVKFVHKIESLQKRAPQHKLAITGILAEFRKRLGGPKNVEAWDRLQKSCQDVVASAILEL